MKKILFAAAMAAVMVAQAEELDRPGGIKIGQRMTLKPYVNFSFTYDSNVDSTKKKADGQSWCVSPGATLEYTGDNWNLTGGINYQYHAYSSKYSSSHNNSSLGENLIFNWSDSENGGKGWHLMLSESFQMISQDDDAMNDGGRGVGRDRQQANFAGVLERRFTEQLHANVNASYYYLNYHNKEMSYAPLYGWTRWMVGVEMGYAASKWTDLLIAANYAGYTQENMSSKYYAWDTQNHIDNDSSGYSVMGGIGSYMTERISYKVLVGWSHYDYCNSSENAPTYMISANWKMTDNWNMMLLGSRYYSPSETARGSSALTDTLSWGIAHSMVRGKVRVSFDTAYRHTEHPFNTYNQNDYEHDIATARLSLNYTINRFVGVFTSFEYQQAWYSGTAKNGNYDYDRWRATVGFRLTY
jgi:hypothetical protein